MKREGMRMYIRASSKGNISILMVATLNILYEEEF